MQHDIIYDVVYYIVCFPIIIIGGMQNGLCVFLIISFALLIAFPPFRTKITLLTPCIVQLHFPFTCVQHRHPPTPDHQLYHFKGDIVCT